ncbi:MAG: murein biosynthesis integral membrane protein MurJ, partial [Firmicutes bacterium]|nr:murein biosynthesis integral membrane protein MurJ [Bacillota bacterium]
MNSKKLIARATVVIATFTLLSKILGFIREMALAYVFGATASTDAFLVAHTIPNIIFAILAGALTLVAVPVFSSYAARDRRDEAWQVFG